MGEGKDELLLEGISAMLMAMCDAGATSTPPALRTCLSGAVVSSALEEALNKRGLSDSAARSGIGALGLFEATSGDGCGGLLRTLMAEHPADPVLQLRAIRALTKIPRGGSDTAKVQQSLQLSLLAAQRHAEDAAVLCAAFEAFMLFGPHVEQPGAAAQVSACVNAVLLRHPRDEKLIALGEKVKGVKGG